MAFIEDGDLMRGFGVLKSKQPQYTVIPASCQKLTWTLSVMNIAAGMDGRYESYRLVSIVGPRSCDSSRHVWRQAVHEHAKC
jgi:hypothetical protein